MGAGRMERQEPFRAPASGLRWFPLTGSRPSGSLRLFVDLEAPYTDGPRGASVLRGA